MTFHDLIQTNSVPTGNTDFDSPAIPAGRNCNVLKFGGFDPAIGDGKDSAVILMWGTVGSFQTIRVGGGGTFDIDINRTFVGDGVKFFRLRRMNNSAVSKPIVAWLEVVVADA